MEGIAMRPLYIILLIFLFISGNTVAQTTESIGDLEPEQYFDFWVGTWDLSWTDAKGNPGKGTNHIEKILDDVVLLENFEATEGSLKGYKGKSMSVYNPQRKSWHQAWVDTQGGYIDLQGKTDGEKRIFQTDEREGPNGNRIISRMVFYDISKDSFIWDWESSTDQGENWKLNWRIRYQRASE